MQIDILLSLTTICCVVCLCVCASMQCRPKPNKHIRIVFNNDSKVNPWDGESLGMLFKFRTICSPFTHVTHVTQRSMCLCIRQCLVHFEFIWFCLCFYLLEWLDGCACIGWSCVYTLLPFACSHSCHLAFAHRFAVRIESVNIGSSHLFWFVEMSLCQANRFADVPRLSMAIFGGDGGDDDID